ncbi:ferredoxin-type protein NapF [Vibrio breoganii]|uniref:ferredoxin-type protein NapF n=1 Tax=Vibrio breoganii TaxID=553239 RepID=UPI000C8467F6|nr:ferredoxin-type protein NapF [Vibrio breoganii]PMG40569.1 ferredoxin-type protein NapF [Vibrio breoganii]PMG95930.1 ferredoxin-type protein NapF [Vibrio breoganii]PMJ47077.1 ferredoxin-type protein NapF [Vibrio breoganii]PMK59025.1 ferredoxin-type protein NapF [Vibrio breoganii]PMM88427.1 ferredoxin-type protein NapF [Vibrio breoganii]
MTDAIDTNRRGFLTRLSKPVTSLSAQAEPTPRVAVRPPQAVDEALFTRLCDGCGKCADACPNSIVHIREGLARIDMDYNECSLCQECTKVCPTGALNVSIKAHIDLIPSFSQGCDNYLQLACTLCQSSCTLAAIQIEEDELPRLDTALCNGCGQCQSSCYVNAITMVAS